MFYRSIVLVLAVSTVLIARADDSPLAAFLTDQSATATTTAESEVLLGAVETKLESQTVVVSVPTPFIDDMSADSETLVLPSNHSMLLEPSSTAPVNMHAASTTITADVPAHAVPARHPANPHA